MYSESNDTFYYIPDDEEPESIEAYKGQIIDGQKYYAIGNCSWCWHQIEEEDEAA